MEMSKAFWRNCCYLLAWICLGYSSYSHAQFFHSATVGDVSKSGKSILLNRGMVEGLKTGVRARFYQDEAQMDFVGVGEVVKVNDNYSFWYFNNIPEQSRPRPSQKLFFAVEEDVLRGRRPLKIVQTKSVQARDRDEVNQENLIPNDLIQKKNSHLEGEKAVKTKATVDYDAQTLESTQWSGGGIPQIVEEYPGELDSVRPTDALELSDTSELRAIEREKTAGMITDGSVQKARISKMKNNDGVIAGKVRGDGYLSDSIPNEFDAYQDQVLAQTKLASETQARVKKNGEMWSAGLSDKELRRTLVESGVLSERERRRKAAANLASHHINLRYSTSIVPQTTDIDPNHNGNNFGMALGYEYLLEHASEKFANWSIEGTIERGISYQDIGGSGINGRIAWGALGFGLHWYPYHKPTAIRKFIPFFGVGIKRGNGDLQSAFLKQSYDVQYLGTDLHAGLRFRFKAGDELNSTSSMGMGFFAMASMENNRVNITTGVEDNIDSVYDISEVRYAFGISAFF
tara:strand:+ start:1468 stop:3015 length:1548 start_codon:yes stop_codon:yes gene_type:complete